MTIHGQPQIGDMLMFSWDDNAKKWLLGCHTKQVFVTANGIKLRHPILSH